MEEEKDSSQGRISNQQEAAQDQALVELGKDGFSVQEFEDLVLLINSRFAGEVWNEETITATLGDVGRTVGVDRAALFLFSEDGKTVEKVFQWTTEGKRPLLQGFHYSLENFTWSLEKLARGEVIRIEDFSSLPQEASAEKRLLEDLGVRSLLAVPLNIAGRLLGFLVLADPVMPRIWGRRVEKLLQIFAIVLGGVLEHRRTEEKLKKEHDFVSTIIMNAAVLIVVLDREGRIVRFNRASEVLSGYTFDEVRGKSFWDLRLIPEEEKERAKSGFRKLVSGTFPLVGESHWLAKSGEKRLISWWSTGLLGSDGEVEHIVAIGVDITEQRRVDEELRFRNFLLTAQQEAILDGVLVVDSRGRIVFYNKRFAEMWGIPQEVLETGSNELAFDFVRDKLAASDHFFRLVRYLYENIGAKSREVVYLKDGRVFDCYFAPVSDSSGTYYGRVWYFRDVTEQRRVERKLRQSFEVLQRVFEESVEALASALEVRDPYTAGHQRRVAQLGAAIAKELGLNREQIRGLYLAALVHDIGKISVPAEVLNKPGRLEELEFGLIKNHPQVGYEILSRVDFPWPIAEIVRQHHERVDGSGYPRGLRGKEILLEARILAVADVVEAISSHRPYRPALGLDVALEEIARNRGKLYDSQVADTCLRLFASLEFRKKFEASEVLAKPEDRLIISGE
jgi:PAS domain S-box-containing protein/putative nucleotidyltransferase with HDIG domain